MGNGSCFLCELIRIKKKCIQRSNGDDPNRSIIGYRSDNISTKYELTFSDSLATCNSLAAEVTSHTLFKEGDVMNILE